MFTYRPAKQHDGMEAFDIVTPAGEIMGTMPASEDEARRFCEHLNETAKALREASAHDLSAELQEAGRRYLLGVKPQLARVTVH